MNNVQFEIKEKSFLGSFLNEVMNGFKNQYRLWECQA